MVDKEQNWASSLSETFQKWAVFVTGPIAFITALVTFVQLYQGQPNLTTTIIIIVGLVCLLIICAYQYFKREWSVTERRNVPTFPKARKWAVSGMIVIPALAIGSATYYFYKSGQPLDKPLVLVAKFDGPDPDKYQIARSIASRIKSSLSKYEVDVDLLEKSFSGSEQARKEGVKRKAAILIWGWYGVPGKSVGLSVTFELLQFPPSLKPFGAASSGNMRTYPQAWLEEFLIQTKLSGELTYLTLFVVGLTKLITADWQNASSALTDALNASTEGKDLLPVDKVRFFRGVAFSAQADFTYSMSDISDVSDGEYPRIFDKLNAAVTDFDAAVITGIPSPEIHIWRGFAYLNRAVARLRPGRMNYLPDYVSVDSDFATAVDSFSKAITLKPNWAQAYYQRGNAFKWAGNLSSAKRDLDVAIGLKQDQPEMYVDRAAVHLMTGNPDQAIADLTKAIRLKPDYVEAYRTRAVIHSGVGDLVRGIDDLTEAIRIRPNYEAYIYRSLMYKQLGEKAKADVDMKKAKILLAELKQKLQRKTARQ